MKHFAIALDGGNSKRRNAITTHLHDKGWPFWHWIDDFWIVQVKAELTAKGLQQQLEAVPSVGVCTMLVFEFNTPIQFFGRGKEEGWDWLRVIGQVSV